jgi:hypothetical protein
MQDDVMRQKASGPDAARLIERLIGARRRLIERRCIPWAAEGE